MSLTCLNVQEDKSEIIHFSSHFSPANSVPTIKVGDCSVTPRNKVEDLGGKLVCHLTFKIHINICCSTSHSIHHIRKIMKFLSRSATERAVSSPDICFFNTWFLQQHSSWPSLLRVKETTTVVLDFDNSGCCNL